MLALIAGEPQPFAQALYHRPRTTPGSKHTCPMVDVRTFAEQHRLNMQTPLLTVSRALKCSRCGRAAELVPARAAWVWNAAIGKAAALPAKRHPRGAASTSEPAFAAAVVHSTWMSMFRDLAVSLQLTVSVARASSERRYSATTSNSARSYSVSSLTTTSRVYRATSPRLACSTLPSTTSTRGRPAGASASYPVQPPSGMARPATRRPSSTQQQSGLVRSRYLQRHFVGAGVESRLAGGWSLRGEYRFSQFDSETVASIPGLLNVDFEPSMHTARLALTYKFGRRDEAVAPASFK